jgi:hypothetical protein
VEIEELFGLLREWMLAQIADQNKDFDQLICVALGLPVASPL